jgi:aminopeptidase N
MLEMMYWSPEQKEEPLKKAMHEFVNRYRNRAATTEQFKEAMEKNMPPWMDIDGNKKLDWFFDPYVYGTALPRYEITSEFTKTADGDAVHIKLTQSNVTDGFHMLVPVYIDMGNGNITRLFNVTMKGNNTLDRTVRLGKLPGQPKRLLLNYNYDVLSDN